MDGTRPAAGLRRTVETAQPVPIAGISDRARTEAARRTVGGRRPPEPRLTPSRPTAAGGVGARHA